MVMLARARRAAPVTCVGASSATKTESEGLRVGKRAGYFLGHAEMYCRFRGLGVF